MAEADQQGFKTAYIEADERGIFIEDLAVGLRSLLFALDRPASVNEKAKRALRIFKSFTIKAGLDGETAFIVPLFDAFMRRTMPVIQERVTRKQR